MVAIDWRHLRSLHGSQNNAFEELCCQLAEYDKPSGSSFIRKGAPDAGVECFVILPDKTEWGWQAKYFLSMGNSQWSQLDESVKTALEKHPKLVKYTVCLPLDPPDARIEGQESLLDKWHTRVEKWTTWATDGGLHVQFEYWGSYQLLERLSREEHRGRFFFWFGAEFFSQSWFAARLKEAIVVAGPRYTPPIHVELPIAQHFESLARTPAFFIRIKHMLRDMKTAYERIHLTNLGDAMELLVATLNEKAYLFFTTVLRLDESLVELLSWITVTEQANHVLQAAYDCLKQVDELKKQEKEEKSQEHKKLFDASQYRGHRDIINDIDQFIGQVHQFRRFAQSVDAKLTNLPYLLLCGEAGQGKTHLFCDIAQKRIAAGLPTLLLMGQRFTQVEPWTQMIQQLGLPATSTRDDLLGALQASAQAKNVKALILIDALNEGDGKKIWFNHLPAMLQTLSRYPWLSLAISVRFTYEHIVIPDELVNNKLIRVEHPGFAGNEYQATRIFFDTYRIEQPVIPLLIPEFQNPLFLKLLCKGLHESGQTKLPVGLHGITRVFKLFVDGVNKKLWRETYYKYHHKPRPLVWTAINHLAETMASRSQDWLLVEEAEATVNQLLPVYSNEPSLYRNIVDEGILIENIRYLGQDESVEVIQFAYEKFSDHIITNYLLDKYLKVNSPEQAFLPGYPLAFLTKDGWQYRGLIEALCIQIPERVGKELPEVAAMMADFNSVGQGFIQSIIWRDPRTITDMTRQYLNKYADHWNDAHDQILNALLTVGTNPDHPFNADFLHARLMKDAMAERDAWWSTFLHYQHGEHDAVDRLVDWAWSPEGKSHIGDDAIRLCGVALTWFLSTPNRFLRDRATKALVNLFTHRIHVLIKVIEMFRDVDDPYVTERLCAVAYGCVMRSVDSVQIKALAQTIYNWIFRDGKPPVHILLRDYARNILEYALHRGIELNVDTSKIRPPYGSTWPTMPEKDTIEELGKWTEGMAVQEWARVAIHSSVMEHGDFGRYVVEHGVHHWTSLRLEEPLWRSYEEKIEDFVNSLTGVQKRKWELYQEVYQRQKEYRWSIEALFAKLTDEEVEAIIQSEATNELQDIEVDEEIEAIKTGLAIAEQDFRGTLNAELLSIFDNQFLPFLRGEMQNDSPPQFDVALARYWIVQRVFEMGWTIERFSLFDRHLDHNNFREAHKAERVGKKYQWIAYHEFLARLADNFQYKEPYSIHPQNHEFNGTWQLSVRDIDPSCVLKVTGHDSSWRETALSWWFTTEYREWDTVIDDVEWLKKSSDLPDLQSLLEVTRPNDDSHWLTLDGFYRWEQPTPPEEDKYNLVRREIWFMLHGYLVHQQDCDELFAWATEQNFMGRWMPEGRDFYQMYLGEFYWSPAYVYHTDPYEGSFGWQEDKLGRQIPKPIMPLVDTYVQEGNGFDCSIDDGISIAVPTQLVAKQMGLEWRRVEGKYFDKSGQLITFDPSVEESGPRTLLVHRDEFLSFLRENSYSIIWTVLGQKQLIGGGFKRDGWKGRLEINGAYRLGNERLKGEVTPQFRSPTDRN